MHKRPNKKIYNIQKKIEPLLGFRTPRQFLECIKYLINKLYTTYKINTIPSNAFFSASTRCDSFIPPPPPAKMQGNAPPLPCEETPDTPPIW
jgi:hypothetical protein